MCPWIRGAYAPLPYKIRLHSFFLLENGSMGEEISSQKFWDEISSVIGQRDVISSWNLNLIIDQSERSDPSVYKLAYEEALAKFADSVLGNYKCLFRGNSPKILFLF